MCGETANGNKNDIGSINDLSQTFTGAGLRHISQTNMFSLAPKSMCRIHHIGHHAMHNSADHCIERQCLLETSGYACIIYFKLLTLVALTSISAFICISGQNISNSTIRLLVKQLYSRIRFKIACTERDRNLKNHEYYYVKTLPKKENDSIMHHVKQWTRNEMD